MPKSKVKMMLICSSDIKGIIHYKLVPPKQSTKHPSSSGMFMAVHSSKETIPSAREVDFVSCQCTFPHSIFGKITFD
jgi:hypothetical protein